MKREGLLNGRSGRRDGRRRGAWSAVLAASLTVWLALAAAVPASAQAQDQADWAGYDQQPLRVNLWHDREGDDVYRRGEPVTITFETNQDAYAVLYRIDAEGEVSLLWPRSRFDDGFVFGRHAYTLPAAGAPRLRAGPQEGVEYVQAIVSLYPFDLRDLEVDFFHETANEETYRFAVAGDPFLAMNEVNYAITRLDNPEDYVITNYLSYYVDRRVEHPRYMCAQCHTGGEVYDPYADTCVITIHHDYGWSNRWYVRYGWYPVYYYPAYYYVDPWSWRPWVNYWYTPWYDWPSVYVYDWPFNCYVWRWSPYWRGDAWARWKSGERRYVPLDKQRFQVDARARDSRFERSTPLVRTPRPPREVERAMETRTRLERDYTVVREGKELRGGGAYRDVAAVERPPVELRGGGATTTSSPGLRVREGARAGNERVLGGEVRDSSRERGSTAPARLDEGRRAPGASARGERTRRGTLRSEPGSTEAGREGAVRPSGRDDNERRSIRPVEPRRPGTRIWSGGRGGQVQERETRTEPSRSGSASGRATAPRVERPNRDDRRDPRQESPRQSQPQARPTPPERSGDRSAPPARSGGQATTRSSGGDSRGRGSRDDGRR